MFEFPNECIVPRTQVPKIFNRIPFIRKICRGEAFKVLKEPTYCNPGFDTHAHIFRYAAQYVKQWSAPNTSQKRSDQLVKRGGEITVYTTVCLCHT